MSTLPIVQERSAHFDLSKILGSFEKKEIFFLHARSKLKLSCKKKGKGEGKKMKRQKELFNVFNN